MKPVTPSSARRRALAALGVVGAAALVLSGCSAGGSSAKTTITVMGPNQWTSDTSTFGDAWDDLIAAFEKDNPDIEVKTNVLPISSWAATSATQLTAGTAPELIFNQTTHKPSQVVDLDKELAKPNPYSDSGDPWIDDFDSTYFGDAQKNAVGHHEWIPFNLVSVGIYVNEDVLAQNKIDVDDLSSFDGLIDACTTLRKKGIEPIATDNGPTAMGWSSQALASMLFPEIAAEINVFDTAGDPGTADYVTFKSLAKATIDGTLDLTKTPEQAELLELLKKLFDACATDNWSGVQPQGNFSGGSSFPAGKAAMSWGTVFAAAGLDDAKFEWTSIPFPTVSTRDSKYVTGEPAKFGTVAGGTSYMIPSYIKGDKRAAAIKFLQYVSSPKITDWLESTGGIPAVKGVKAPSTISALTSKDWSSTPLIAGLTMAPATPTGGATVEGYLLGTRTLAEVVADQQQNNELWAAEQIEQNGWSDLG
ncbi:hypothetical protein GCM10027515_04540 [Schumannella luteola]|uniref:Multiple sugar transport system substrate-binding protein n=1 Tax=Schumannella luteola TaxID=472059 RepID=A0A852YAM8_9MICO|nr:ABC transporter substrate-binding protein [Schumannella luteola]NYG98410.1 multiple sugar transport system substrate-binding protein [Schumannella luteola]TPX01353.1 carbohydrate ABC transporter substrate-binding protein [Schumannella luteola]